MSVRLSCPSCNTAFALGAIPEHRRATCPRCGDVFPVRGEVTESEGSVQTTEAKAQTAAPSAKRGLSPGRAVAFILALGLVGFAVGLAVHYSRGPKPKPEAPSRPEGPPGGTREPLDYVPGLADLPAECNVVFAIRPGLIVDYATRTKQDPRALLVSASVPAQAFAALDQFGIGLADVDHIVGGAFIGGEGEELRLALVIVTNRQTDDEAILRRLKAKRASEKSSLYTVELNPVPVALLLEHRPRWWTFGLNERDFQRDKSQTEGRHFRGVEVRDGQERLVGVRKWLSQVERDTAIWVVADDDRDWAQKPLVKLASQSPEAKKWLPTLGSFRGGMFAVTLGEQPYMSLAVRTADEASAERLRAHFRAHGPKDGGYGTGTEAGFRTPFDPATARATLQKLLTGLAK